MRGSFGQRDGPRRVLDAAAARLVAADLLSRRAWTAAELATRLRRRGAPAALATEVVADLTTRGHVDDAAFARHWVDARAARGYGSARLRSELRARGVGASLIDAALASLPAAGAVEAARGLARRRLAALRRGAPDRAAARLRDYLLRRGYGAGVATRVAREVLGRGGDESADE